MKTILLGLLLGLLAAFPHLALPLAAGTHWITLQPIAWAFTAGLLTRPHIARRLTRSTT